MKRKLIGLALAALAIFGGTAQAADVIGVAKGALAGTASQVDETTYSIGATLTIVDATVQSATDYSCTILGLGEFDGNGQLVKPFPNDEVTWNASCSDGGQGTFSAAFLGSNRPLKRAEGDTGHALLQFGGPAAFNGDDHGHVATCKGQHQFPQANFLCVIL